MPDTQDPVGPTDAQEAAATRGGIGATAEESVVAMVLAALRLTAEVAGSQEVAGRSLTLEGVACLLALAEPDHAVGRLARAAAGAGDLRATRRDLVAAGLLAQSKGEDGKQVHSLTDAGMEMAAALRADLARIGTRLDERVAKSAPRFVGAMRAVSAGFSLAEKPRRARNDAA